MTRRNTLKALVAASVGTFALGYWAKDQPFIKDLISNSFFKSKEQDLITAIADTIIPKGKLYGAVGLGVPVYLLAYFGKCLEKEEQENIRFQLEALNQTAIQQFNTDFSACSQDQREELLLAFAGYESDTNPESQPEKTKEKDFFNLMKKQTIHGFRTTKEVMTDHYNYQLTPGHYFGCIDITEKSVS